MKFKKYIAPKSEIVKIDNLLAGAGFDWTNSEAEQWGKENDTIIDDDDDFTTTDIVDEEPEFQDDSWDE